MKYQNFYQYALIGFALLVALGIAAFVYHEVFPEYKKYQYAYEGLEKFRSTYTHEPPAPFSKGIKQILVPNPTGSLELIDRCISCHVAVDLPHFSPTRIASDAEGHFTLEPNPDYVWTRLDQCINELRAHDKNAEADKLARLKTVEIEGKRVDVEKVIQMHPLMPGETRPFEHHPMAEYGCTSCHSGNGRALVAKRAHGPVYDGDYEPFYSTPKPQFTEVDPQNDPSFSRMYNSKPGHELIFQTTPLLAGPLMVANCVQCHQSVAQPEEKNQVEKKDVDKLIAGYQRGKELFVSQACYACHRIAGYSRASVGPELTKEGNSYPWYVKESIVWPQSDLPSSTMPNFRLDHDELIDLVTFLMAQKGNTQAVSEMDYRIELDQWEKGAKMPWELPVAPTQIDNVRAGQLVFASEGCAACHKLQGFETNTYFKEPEKDKEWFYKHFPEQISGSSLAKTVKAQAAQIDQRILVDESRNGVVEEIIHKFPGLVEGFYTHFKFADRAIKGPDQKRLHRVLLAYIQEYGLGRDIAPHLNWSGIYRNNEWLLGHFHNPSAYTAKSIMPVMPFDDSKFYMLNSMLHQLGKKNRDSLQEIWRTQGFNPSLAYEWLCSSCHGTQRQGNGIISEWIYPIPKNLRNPVFLQNLTKERAIESITHGVQGSPMPPWGETVSDMGTAVLSQPQIMQLVDWLYQGVPYDSRTATEVDCEKWHYMPTDVVIEMEKEKRLLQPAPTQASNTQERVHDYFLEKPNTIPGPDKELFYIREKYYTPSNLAEAKDFFMVNCATCHGNEGTGSGLRATSMVEAKPRMFTHLPWIRTKDDLRLLRSIKYGVPGTAMTPWGDQTTAQQRMQLVMFIREFTRATLLRGELEEILYNQFDVSIQTIEQARAPHYQQLEALRTQLQSSQEALCNLTSSEETIGSLYAQTVKLKKAYANAQAHDETYQHIIRSLKDEREIYASLGNQVIGAELPEETIRLFFKLVEQQPLTYTIENGKLIYSEKSSHSDDLLRALDALIASYQHQINVQRSKISSTEIRQTIQKLVEQQTVCTNLRTKLVTQLAAAAQLRIMQKTFYGDVMNSTKELM